MRRTTGHDRAVCMQCWQQHVRAACEQGGCQASACSLPLPLLSCCCCAAAAVWCQAEHSLELHTPYIAKIMG